MTSIGIDREQIKIAMTENVLDILCIIPKSEILKKGMPYVKDAIKSSGLLKKSCELKWNKFWIYFKKFWMSSKMFIAIWNIHGNDENELEMHSRVNNGLER